MNTAALSLPDLFRAVLPERHGTKLLARMMGAGQRSAERYLAGDAVPPADKLITAMAQSDALERAVLALVQAERERGRHAAGRGQRTGTEVGARAALGAGAGRVAGGTRGALAAGQAGPSGVDGAEGASAGVARPKEMAEHGKPPVPGPDTAHGGHHA